MWADDANRALARVGSKERIHRSEPWSSSTGTPWRAGDERGAARLKYREPGVHIGPHNVARAERGVALERTATAQGGGGSAIRSLRATAQTSEKMEGTLCPRPAL